MNYADLESTWRSARNEPAPAHLESMKQHFLAEHDRRRRGLKLFLGLVGAALTVITLRFAFFALRDDPAGGGFDPGREWGSLLFMLLPWAGVGFLVRQLARHDRAPRGAEPTLADGVRALLDENRLSRTRLKMVAWLHIATLILLPLVVSQLRAVGKAGDEVLLPAYVGWPAISIAILLGMRWHYRHTLQPRQVELEALLKHYE